MKRTKQAGFTLFELLIVIATLGTLAITCGSLFVGWHFISKFW